jgi:glycosyltransferase involved in cell wall biosynthesis
MLRANHKILMVLGNNTYPFDRRVRLEAETLAGAGYHVTVLCPAGRGERQRETIDGVDVFRFPATPEGSGVIGYLFEFAYSAVVMFVFALYLLLTQKFDIVHVHNPPDTVFLIKWLAQVMGKRFVFDHNDLSPELYLSKFGKQGDLFHRGLLLMEHLCCRGADLVIATNQSYRELQIQRHKVDAGKIEVVRNAPRIHEFADVKPNEALRRTAKTILVYVGHISAQDGVDYLLRSLNILCYELGQRDFYCVIVGPADDMDGLQRLSRELKIDSKVRFTGRLPFGAELLSYLMTADIGVEPAPSNPLNDKSTMIKITEYMAMGKPIVAYDLSESRYTAEEAALFAEKNNERDFAQKISILMGDADMRKRMGEFGQKRMQSHLSWQHSADNLLMAYERMLNTATEPVRPVS